MKLVVDTYERFDLNVIRTEEKRGEYISKGSEMFSRFWEENLQVWDDSLADSLVDSLAESLADSLAESGYEVRLDDVEEVDDLDLHRIS